MSTDITVDLFWYLPGRFYLLLNGRFMNIVVVVVAELYYPDILHPGLKPVVLSSNYLSVAGRYSLFFTFIFLLTLWSQYIEGLL